MQFNYVTYVWWKNSLKLYTVKEREHVAKQGYYLLILKLFISLKQGILSKLPQPSFVSLHTSRVLHPPILFNSSPSKYGEHTRPGPSEEYKGKSPEILRFFWCKKKSLTILTLCLWHSHALTAADAVFLGSDPDSFLDPYFSCVVFSTSWLTVHFHHWAEKEENWKRKTKQLFQIKC